MTASAVRALVEDKDGTVWCGTTTGALYRCAPAPGSFSAGDALAGQPILSLAGGWNRGAMGGHVSRRIAAVQRWEIGRITAEQGCPATDQQFWEDGQGSSGWAPNRAFAGCPTSLLACLGAGHAR